MFDYTLSTEVDATVFNKYDEMIKKIPNVKAETLLEDVNGSLIQIYYLDDKKIKLIMDEDVGATYIESEIELKNYITFN
ncbi:hypothetical protein [Alkaliphilus sp. B6464]|uniref:hypothetical protein n=1 Tax=Alkaliphilus sp. B6464 TaxID=2731219 RepID=UPI001BAC488B|nr:hypothetical protein [Alkaliphilus sp. B6464]QUH21427.1 hypothetical protein HYG84_17090 [Alkaliphilus sp. B6464]